MVNSVLIPTIGSPADPEVALAIAYAPVAVRPALKALWALDEQLASIVRTTRDVMAGQLRLTWWYEALGDGQQAGDQPVLAALRQAGWSATTLQRLVAGWEELLEEPDDAVLSAYAADRAALFELAGLALGTTEPAADAGAGWALVDLARHHSVPAVADRALRLAEARLRGAPRRWSRAGRPLGILTKLARRDLGGIEVQGSPRRLWAAATLALSGR